MNKLLRKKIIVEKVNEILEEDILQQESIYNKNVKFKTEIINNNSNIYDKNLTMTLKHKNNLIINNWDTECDNALFKIKTIIMKNPIIILANSDKQFIIYTDASKTAIGAGIFQKNQQN